MIIYLQMIDTPEDRSKFEQIYLEYRGLMFHVANEILHNEQDAEDAVHQAFLNVAENMKKSESRSVQKPRAMSLRLLRTKQSTCIGGIRDTKCLN